MGGYHHGMINEDFLKANIADFDKQLYVCGPPPMMDAVLKQLKNLGVGPKGQAWIDRLCKPCRDDEAGSTIGMARLAAPQLDESPRPSMDLAGPPTKPPAKVLNRFSGSRKPGGRLHQIQCESLGSWSRRRLCLC